MRTSAAVLLFGSAFGMIGCKGAMEGATDVLSPSYDRIPEEDIDPDEQIAASTIGDDFLTRSQEGRFVRLGAEATRTMRRGLTPRLQKESWEEISGMYGDYDHIEFDSAWSPSDGTQITVYRFRVHFVEVAAHPELRVILNGKGKLSGLWIKPWIPMLWL